MLTNNKSKYPGARNKEGNKKAEGEVLGLMGWFCLQNVGVWDLMPTQAQEMRLWALGGREFD